MGASLSGPELKVWRAKKHLEEVEELLQRFTESDPYELVAENDPETGRREVKVARAEAIPAGIGLAAGDCIHNLRSALDHLIWQLVVANDGNPEDLQTAFPVWRTEADFVSAKPGPAKGISKQALDLLYGLKPYKGGNDALWRLHRLDIVDKHRLLLAVASNAESTVVNLGALGREVFELPGMKPIPDLPDMPTRLPAANLEIVEVGKVLYSFPIGEKAHEETQFAIQIALLEPDVPRGEPLLKALHEVSSSVDEVIDLFRPLV